MLASRFAQNQSTSTENRKAVIGSKVVAKAVTRLANGGYEIIVVFASSTRQEFYWIFKAKSARSARRSWKYTRHHQRDYSFANKPYRDFSSFVSWCARSMAAEIVSVRIPHKRWLDNLLVKTAHESIYGTWIPQDPAKIKTVRIQRRAHNARRGFAW
jgi:hypothetical protein